MSHIYLKMKNDELLDCKNITNKMQLRLNYTLSQELTGGLNMIVMLVIKNAVYNAKFPSC